MKTKNQRNRSLIAFFCLFAVCCSVQLFAENEFSFRLAPAFEAPMKIKIERERENPAGGNPIKEDPVKVKFFKPGMGASLSLDWAFWNFAKIFNFGIKASGSFTSLPFIDLPDEKGDPLTLLGGMGGLFLRLRPFDRWAFGISANAGAYQYSRAGENATKFIMSYSLGTEFLISPYISLYADGVYSYRVFDESPLQTIGAVLGIRLNLSEIMGSKTRVQVDKTQQFRVFPVSWAWYENNPVAAVTVTNEEPNAITDLNLNFFMDSYMSEPFTFAVVPRLAPGESIEVPVTALFNEAMLSLSENVSANGVLQMQYRSLGARKEKNSGIQMPIFRRNNMSWDDDRRAAAFVSPRDGAVKIFARYVAGAVETAISSGDLQSGNIPSNVLYAAALFEALRLYRITYIVDPSSAYAALSDDESEIDSLNYPYETLYYRGGDCDDLSILFCSLLEALNIQGAFITIPGHIYTAFEVGDDAWQANNSRIIEIEGMDGIRRRWMPLETTITDRGFTQGWQVGAMQWTRAGEEAALFPIRECWELYPSVTVPASGDSVPVMPEWDDIVRAVSSFR
ncbi:MAG: hypothetical protein FWH41_02655 [Treponema sp.]|nr:hypothetical protein [Treponema sp.]